MKNKIAKTLFVVVVMCTCGGSLHAQEHIVDHSFNTWWSNVNKYNLSPKWYLSSEIHVRRTEGLKRWQQFLVRPAVNFKLNEHVHFTAGYTYILSYPYGNQAIPLATPENNVWEQVTLKHKVGRMGLSHRYRLEHRFIGKRVADSEGVYHIDGSNYAQRFRYRLTGVIPFVQSGRWFIKWFDEVWVNLENNFLPVSLNQNWLYAGVGFKFTEHGTVGLGFMDQVIIKGDGIHVENNPTLQFTVGYAFGKSGHKQKDKTKE